MHVPSKSWNTASPGTPGITNDARVSGAAIPSNDKQLLEKRQKDRKTPNQSDTRKATPDIEKNAPGKLSQDTMKYPDTLPIRGVKKKTSTCRTTDSYDSKLLFVKEIGNRNGIILLQNIIYLLKIIYVSYQKQCFY